MYYKVTGTIHHGSVSQLHVEPITVVPAVLSGDFGAAHLRLLLYLFVFSLAQAYQFKALV